MMLDVLINRQIRKTRRLSNVILDWGLAYDTSAVCQNPLEAMMNKAFSVFTMARDRRGYNKNSNRK
jgi:hypothetical protein